jgi:hypothetical protein
MSGDLVVFGVVVPDLAVAGGAIAGLWLLTYTGWLILKGTWSGR